MFLKDSNLWLVVSLLVTTIIAPVVTWNFQQGKIEKQKIEFENKKLALQMELEDKKLAINKNQQLLEMYDHLGRLLMEQRKYYDAYTELAQKGNKASKFDLQRKRLQMSEKYEEIEETKKIISSLSGKNLDEIKGSLPPLPVTGLKIKIN